MRTRLFKDSDYEMVKGWWIASGSPVVSLSQLQTTGLIGFTADNEPACALWAYKSRGVGVAFLEHLVTNHEVTSPMQKMKAVQYMMDHMLDLLKMDGYQMIRGTTWCDTLAKVCHKRWGFEIIDDNSINMSLLV